jgi:hypothetical protein
MSNKPGYIIAKRFALIRTITAPGYPTFQQATYSEQKGLALDTDLVILQFKLTDVVERYHTLAQYGGANFLLGIDTREGTSGVMEFFCTPLGTLRYMRFNDAHFSL